MGPPKWVPSASTWRYFTARTISAYLVIMPKKADTHIQKTAPGPPAKMAPVTPAMLPVPTVPARAVETAWKGVRFCPPEDLSVLRNREPRVLRSIKPNLRA